MARSGRLLNLLQLLRGRRTPVTASELAHELAVSERTIYRDIATLTSEGAPIVGEAGMGYVLGPGLFLPPLMLDVDEAEAILLGLKYVSQRGDDVLRQAAAVAQAKIASILPTAIQAAFEEPVAMTGPDRQQAEGPVEVSLIRRAIKTQTKLSVRYLDSGATQTDRVIWPISVGFLETARVVGAWCELRQDFRMFRLDRIAFAIEGDRYPGRRATLLKRMQGALRRS